uniref:Uncharacterized protein n=1 Tax=Cannabis sativa TaxID=3483 RepID=A0A803PK82_CANSA
AKTVEWDVLACKSTSGHTSHKDIDRDVELWNECIEEASRAKKTKHAALRWR